MKKFLFDILLNEENICNLHKEKEFLKKAVMNNKRIIIYGNRNTGKTSLIKNVIIPHFKAQKSKTFVLFADLMSVKDKLSIDQRIKFAFEHAFTESFPAASLLQSIKKFILNLRPEIKIDALTGEPSLSLKSDSSHGMVTFHDIFNIIKKKIIPDIPTLLVLDEFQDISLVDEASALFRQELQELNETSIILMGSKKHLLGQIFSIPNAPLAQYGEDLLFSEIPYDEYYLYMKERFEQKKIKLGKKLSIYIQDLLFKNPEAINMVCYHLFENHQSVQLNEKDVVAAMNLTIANRKSRFEELLTKYTQKEELVMVAIAKLDFIKQPSSKSFTATVNTTSRAVGQIIKRLMNDSIIIKEPRGYRIYDPLLYYYLKAFR